RSVAATLVSLVDASIGFPFPTRRSEHPSPALFRISRLIVALFHASGKNVCIAHPRRSISSGKQGHRFHSKWIFHRLLGRPVLCYNVSGVMWAIGERAPHVVPQNR